MPVGSVRQALETSSLSPEAILLSRIPLFRDLSTAQLRLLAEHLQPRDLLPNETVVRAGETGRELFIIGWGELQVSVPEDGKTDRAVAQLGPGEFFGEMALLRDEPRSATVRALSDAQVFSLSADNYARFIQEMPSLQNALAQVGSRRQLELRMA
jgi:CRP-like cAMP-binding protein